MWSGWITVSRKELTLVWFDCWLFVCIQIGEARALSTAYTSAMPTYFSLATYRYFILDYTGLKYKLSGMVLCFFIGTYSVLNSTTVLPGDIAQEHFSLVYSNVELCLFLLWMLWCLLIQECVEGCWTGFKRQFQMTIINFTIGMSLTFADVSQSLLAAFKILKKW